MSNTTVDAQVKQALSAQSDETILSAFLLGIGDDLLILGHRLSEWCGHAPILEEDIALANIALDCIGQANGALTLAATLEDKGRSADALAFLREADAFRNVQLVEQPNGDFAMTIVRQVLFDAHALPFFEQLAQSTFSEVSGLAAKAAKETTYHLRHSSEWFRRLAGGTDESNRRMQVALNQLWEYSYELAARSSSEIELSRRGVIPDLKSAREVGEGYIRSLIASAELPLPPANGYRASGGRSGFHTEHLSRLLAEMQVLHRAHPGAVW